MHDNVFVESVLTTLRGYKFPLKNEDATQRGIESALKINGIPYNREYILSKQDRIDFVVGSGPQFLGIEVKIKCQKTAIWRQLCRYAESDEIFGLVLVSNTAMGLPEYIEEKPVWMVSLGSGWLR